MRSDEWPAWFSFWSSGCWRALAKGTAWAGFYCVIHHHRFPASRREGGEPARFVLFCFHLGPALLRPNLTRNSALGPRHTPAHAPHLCVTLAEPRRPAACAPRPRQIWHWRVARQEQRSSPQERRPKTVSYQLMLLSLGLEQVVRHHQRARRGDKKVRKSSDPAARRNLLMKLLSH